MMAEPELLVDQNTAIRIVLRFGDDFKPTYLQ